MKVIIYSAILVAFLVNPYRTIEAHNINVPKIGDTSSRFMSIAQENKLGGIIYSQILGSFNLINDPLITSYILSLIHI